MNAKPIGVFDSGIGGLTVVRSLHERLPHENIVYFGDTARVPYGPKSALVVREYAAQDTDFLLGHDVKLVVVACNSAAAVALDALADRLPIPVIGVIEPGLSAAASATRNGRVGVIGTVGTIASGALLFTAAPFHRGALMTAFERERIPLAEIGEVSAGSAGSVCIVRKDGKTEPLPYRERDEILKVFE